MPKTAPDYLEKLHPRSGEECTCGATYRNAMIGRPETPFADYALMLRRQGNYRLARLIEIHHGEQHNLKFFDFFPAQGELFRIDDRNTEPLEGWRLDQDRRMKDDLWMYEEGGWVK